MIQTEQKTLLVAGIMAMGGQTEEDITQGSARHCHVCGQKIRSTSFIKVFSPTFSDHDGQAWLNACATACAVAQCKLETMLMELARQDALAEAGKLSLTQSAFKSRLWDLWEEVTGKAVTMPLALDHLREVLLVHPGLGFINVRHGSRPTGPSLADIRKGRG